MNDVPSPGLFAGCPIFRAYGTAVRADPAPAETTIRDRPRYGLDGGYYDTLSDRSASAQPQYLQ